MQLHVEVRGGDKERRRTVRRTEMPELVPRPISVRMEDGISDVHDVLLKRRRRTFREQGGAMLMPLCQGVRHQLRSTRCRTDHRVKRRSHNLCRKDAEAIWLCGERFKRRECSTLALLSGFRPSLQ